MSYDRGRSPMSGGGGWGGDGVGGADGYSRDPYARPPSPGGYRRDDYPPASAGYEDSYRRGRSPDDDRRKRRRSPSPAGMAPSRTDTYIPSYTRERSPPNYREGRRGGDYYEPGGERYDSRGGRDYDGDRSRGGPPPRSQMKPPSELPYLASFQYFRDWIRDEDHRTYDDKTKLDEAYKKYKLQFLTKQQKAFFEEVKEMSWCKEKYGLSEEEVGERKRLREMGREGKMDAFLAALNSGSLDDISFDGKMPTPASPAKREVKLEQPKDETSESVVKNEENTDAKVEGEESAVKDGNVKKEEPDDNAAPADTAAEEAKPKIEAEEKPKVETEEAAVEASEGDALPKPEDDENVTEQKADDNTIEVPAMPTTLFIKSVSPDISRADLETHCKQVAGFDHVALSEPNSGKRFHRVGWIVFKPDANMTEAVEKLCESKINNFTLHMHLADKPTYQRLRVAPSLCGTPENIRSSLEKVQQIIKKQEQEAGDDRGSQAIEQKAKSLAGSAEGTEENGTKSEKHDRLILDISLQYLRSVFHICYYCICASDFSEELTRKCVKHVRRAQSGFAPKGKTSEQSETSWIKSHDEKLQLLIDREAVDPADFGGENYNEKLSELAKEHITVEDEGKYRCKTCKKLFKAAPFVEKHILNKHPELIGDTLEHLKYFNNFVLDPGHVMPPVVDAPMHMANAAASGMLYNGMASTFGAFSQMFNPQFGMMGGFNAGGFGYGMPGFAPMNFAGYNGAGGAAGFAGGMAGAMPIAGGRGGTGLAERIGGRNDYGDNRGGKRPRRNEGMMANAGLPPPPPKGAKVDPRAARLHAYTDLDGPPAGGGDVDMLDY